MVARPRMSSTRVWGIAVMVAVCLISAHTTFAQGRAVQGVTAKASNSLWAERHPNNLLNANGMDPTETYFYNVDGTQAGEPTSGNDVEWVTTSIGLNADILAEDKVWIVFDLGAIIPVARLDLWNWQWNHPSVGDLSNRGLARFDVYVRATDADTDDGTANGTPINVDQVFDSQISAAVPFDLGTVNPWELVLEDQVLSQAPNTDTHTATSYDLGNRLARFVAIKVDDWYGGNGCALGKVRLYTVSDTAHMPSPGHEADDVLRDVTLSWKPGDQAVTHDVYWGAEFDAVYDATVPDIAGLDVNSLNMGVLPFGQTYYWRVDEVSAAPDNTIFKGDVWSFTTELLAYPIANVTATSNGTPDVDSDPENTVNGSGLNAEDQHSIENSDMWLASPAGDEPLAITFAFDRVHKMHEMVVWNYNVAFELLLGLGLKDITVEYSTDGAEWVTLGDVVLAQATAKSDYAAPTTVDLQGVPARYVRLIVNSGHGTTGKFGLSEVRFSRIPTEAGEFSPADDSTSERVDVTLGWRAGREAVAHEVYLGTNPETLDLAGVTEAPSLALGDLEYGQTYYWQVVEVNESETPARYASDILSFSTPAYALVDDFEGYSDTDGQEIFMTWLDGYGGDTSLGGSTTGHFESPFAEISVVNSGRQSMPVYIDNDGSFGDIDGNTRSPAFSEVVREFDPVQDWIGHGLGTLSLMFAGSTDLTGQLYVKINHVRVDYAGDAAQLGSGEWTSWIIDLSTVGTDLQQVASLAIGVEGPGESRILYIDDIRLYPPVVAPVSSQVLQGITAKASNSYSEARHPNNLLNANGMDPTGTTFYNIDGSEAGEPTSGNDTEWVTTSNGLNPAILADEKVWIVFDLGDIMPVARLDLWNWQWNHPSVGDLSNRGMAQFDVYVRATDADTDDGTAGGTPINLDQVFDADISGAVPFALGMVDPWQLVLEAQALAQAPNTDDHTATSYDLGGVSARFVAIVAKDWYGGNGVGLGKVRVYSVSGD